MTDHRSPVPAEFSPAAKQAVYDAISLRRDIRGFRPDPVPDEVLLRVLAAAHRAGSVGFMQPWDFVLVRSAARKEEVYELFRRANERAMGRFEGDRRERYASLKLQGILDAPLSVCVTCDTRRGGPHVLGRDTIRETDVYSTCLAVQNLWLAARAEGVGVGWVSIVDNDELAACLELPAGVLPVAFLCMGYPVEFPETPLLEATGWRGRLDLDPLVHFDAWGGAGAEDPLRARLRGTTDEAGRPGSAGGAGSAGSLEDADSAGGAGPGRVAWSRGIESGGAASAVEEDISRLAGEVRHPDPLGERAARLRERLDALTKPRGSMGALEELAVRLARAQGRDFPSAERAPILLFAGDHGVVAEGVSAYRAEVTARLCYNFVAGGGVVNALARVAGTEVRVVDVGVDHDFEAASGVEHRKVRRGSRNLAVEDALTREEAAAALLAGAAAAAELGPVDLLLVGEVGIGNSTSAAALLALCEGVAAEEVVGRGTGVGDEARARKVRAVARAVERGRSAERDPLGMLAAAGGLEIAALTGAILTAAGRGVPVVLDGFITGVAARLASELAPEIREYCVASHRSAEPGHRRVLERLGLEPLLQLEMRLGEASGAALALPLLRGACALLRDVRTFREAGMEEPVDARSLR